MWKLEIHHLWFNDALPNQNMVISSFQVPLPEAKYHSLMVINDYVDDVHQLMVFDGDLSD